MVSQRTEPHVSQQVVGTHLHFLLSFSSRVVLILSVYTLVLGHTTRLESQPQRFPAVRPVARH